MVRTRARGVLSTPYRRVSFFVAEDAVVEAIGR
jgi:hypothetical protein